LDAHASDLLMGMLQDVGAILRSFEGGPDDPASPVTNAATLQNDSDHLDSATAKAEQLASEIGSLGVLPQGARGR
jgi:hypothetical protein